MKNTKMVAALLLFGTIGVQGFVRPSGTKFVDDCGEYLPHGWNTWGTPLMDLAMAAAANPAGGEAGQLTKMFSDAQGAGMNTMRMFLPPVDGTAPMQFAPGQYNEARLKGLDFLLKLANDYNVKILPVFVNQWQMAEGAQWYLDPTNPGGQSIDRFWADPGARQRVKDYMTYLTSRTNSFTGKQYKDDPAIFGWHLYNELRCPSAQNQDENQLAQCLKDIADWINDVACHLKAADPNHMVGLGEEGFFGRDSDLNQNNPTGVPGNVGPGWSKWVGQDFQSQHSSSCIDFASFHMWMDNWQTFDLEWIDGWMNAHSEAASRLGKPVILAEFGKRTDPAREASIRDPVVAKVYTIVATSINNGGPLRGSLIWYWDALNGVTNNAGPEHQNGNFPPTGAVVRSGSSTWGLVVGQGMWQKGQAPGCGVTAASVAG